MSIDVEGQPNSGYDERTLGPQEFVDSYSAVDGGDEYVLPTTTIHGGPEAGQFDLVAHESSADERRAILMRPGLRVIVPQPDLGRTTVVDVINTPNRSQKGSVALRFIVTTPDGRTVVTGGQEQAFNRDQAMAIPVPPRGIVKIVHTNDAEPAHQSVADMAARLDAQQQTEFNLAAEVARTLDQAA